MATNVFSALLNSEFTKFFSITDGNQTGLDITGDFTMEAWIKYDTDGGLFSGGVYDRGATGGGFQIALGNTTGIITTTVFGTSTSFSYSSSFTLTDDTWTHIAVVFDSTAFEVDLYIDGSFEETITGGAEAPGTTTTTANIGRFFTNHMNNMRIWSDKRTSGEISDNYNGCSLDGTEANLEAWWEFQNDATDTTSNGNDLTNNGSTTFDTEIPFTCPVLGSTTTGCGSTTGIGSITF